MIWYSHLFKNFPQFVVIHTIKVFSIVNKAKVDVFLESPCFFYDPMNVGNLVSGSSAFSKSSLYIRKFSIHILLKPNLKNLEHNLALEHISGEKNGLKRYVHPNVHYRAIYNRQDVNAGECPLTGEWIKKMCLIYTMEYYSAFKKNEIMPFAPKLMDLETIILSEVYQRKINIICIAYLIHILLK